MRTLIITALLLVSGVAFSKEEALLLPQSPTFVLRFDYGELVTQEIVDSARSAYVDELAKTVELI